MKRLAALAAAAILVLSMAACSAKCKWDGCDDKAAKNGYCEVHYAMHELEKLFAG